MINSIFVYGDSISMQWGIPFHEMISGEYKYDRLGGGDSKDLADKRYNGETSRSMLEWIEQLEKKDRCELLFNCGLHDIKRDFMGNYEVPVDEYRDNLQKIISIAKNNFDGMIWLNTTPVDDKRHMDLCSRFVRRNKDVLSYNITAKELMDANKIPIIDLYSVVLNILDENEAVYMDHVHFNKNISKILSEVIVDSLREMIR